MPGQNQCRDVANLQIQLISTIMKLAKYDLPIVALWYTDNDIKMYGTKHLKNFFSKLDQTVIDNAIKEDVLNLGSLQPDEPLLSMTEENVPEKVRAKQVFQNFYSGKLPDELPFPLSCMNKKQKIIWLTKQMLQEQREASGEVLFSVKYGDLNLKPSFWLNEEWDWVNLTKNLSNISNQMYTGPGDFQDFLTRLIVKCLTMRGKDPETYVDPNVNKKTLNRKKKNKGIHEESHIVPDELPTDELEVESEAPASEYRLPGSATNQPSSFIPRRRMPDNLEPRFPGFGPASPSATPVQDHLDEMPQPGPTSPPPPAAQPSYCNMENIMNDNTYMFPTIEPFLMDEDFEYSWLSRNIKNPPGFLSNILDPLHPGWKCLENDGGGSCLYRAGADHI